MALFTDASVVTLDDLLRFENTLVQVSSTHGIDINTKIKLATDEIGDKVMLFLLRSGQSDPQWSVRARIGLATVVVTPAMFKWLCCDSLARTFAEAYNVQLNTRFQGKWAEYQKQAEAASEIVFASGIGIVFNPLPRPLLPVLSTGTGSFQPQSLFVQTSWTSQQGEESELSPVNGVILNGFSRIQISMAEQGTAIPNSASGWNVYVSGTQEQLSRQNLQPLSLGSSWSLPDNPLIAGSPALGGGQVAARFISANRRWQRG